MNYIVLVNEVIDYIENNLNKNINMEELSNHFFISKYYLNRIFKALTSYRMKEYIDKRKMTEAAKQLIETERKIIDIAFEFGYASHEVFTRTFKKVFSITPMQLRKTRCTIDRYEKIQIVEREFKNLNKDLVVDFELIHKKRITLYGEKLHFDPNNEHSLRKLTPFVETFVHDYILNRNVDRMYNVITCGNEVNQYGYFAGFYDSSSTKPSDLCELSIPECDYAVFKYSTDLTDIHKTVMHDICRTIMISQLSLKKEEVDFFLIFENDYYETQQYAIYVPVKE